MIKKISQESNFSFSLFIFPSSFSSSFHSYFPTPPPPPHHRISFILKASRSVPRAYKPTSPPPHHRISFILKASRSVPRAYKPTSPPPHHRISFILKASRSVPRAYKPTSPPLSISSIWFKVQGLGFFSLNTPNHKPTASPLACNNLGTSFLLSYSFFLGKFVRGNYGATLCEN